MMFIHGSDQFSAHGKAGSGRSCSMMFMHGSDQLSVARLVVVDHGVWCFCMDLISSQWQGW